MPESPSELGQIQSLRRSLTLPTKLNPLAQRRASVPNTPEHVIFYHPSAKIVHFSPRALAPIPSSSAPSDFDYPVDTIETLPWRSATERTVATAPLRLEKVQGSTAFLKCGNVVHAILKNSQCWCVDGVSKFVLRIRPLTYYRIEIPYESDEDRGLVQDLKIAFPTVLRYEVTPCPFKRAFSVELPTDAMAPRRRKAWQPKDRRERVPAVLEAPQETPSPSSAKSEWIDSVSTGDDTDGNLTDDSCFTSNKASSTVLESIPGDLQAPPIDVPGPPPYNGPPRRSVTETPQTFTSLLAKFEATTLAEDDHSGFELKQEDAPNSDADAALQVDTLPQAHPSQIESEVLAADSGVEAGHEAESATDAEIRINKQAEAKSDPEVVPEAISEDSLEARSPGRAADHSEPSIPTEAEPALQTGISEEDILPPKPTITIEPVTSVEYIDHDASFASSTESFHSAEPQSPDSVSTHPTSVGGNDLPDSTEMFNLSGAKELISGFESMPASQCMTSQPPARDVSEQDNSSNATRMQDNPSAHNASQNGQPRRFPDAFSDTSPTMTRSSKASSPTRFVYTSSDAMLRPQPSTEIVGLNPDLGNMSAEFRRRAKATKERDLSPMPHSSALYQPSGDDASSFISKAITLVLIPPAYLFVILLHIAARIVINPTPNRSITSSANDSKSRSQHNKNPSAAEDDFSFPLKLRSSLKNQDPQNSKKRDPWDLD